MGTIGEAPEVSRGPIRKLLGVGMEGHIRALYIVTEVNGGDGHLWCRIKGYSPGVPFVC